MKFGKYLVGIDEAGRGPLAGPVAVASFCVSAEFHKTILDFFPKRKIRDSKKLSPKRREEIFKMLKQAKFRREISLAVSFGSAGRIDKLGIAVVIRKSVEKVLARLPVEASECLVLLDGALRAPSRFLCQKTIIRGDETEAVIALASIVAKISRDRRMVSLAKKYPRYGFDIHKGYGTKRHYAALKKYGPSPVHRRTFLKNLVK